MFLGNLNDCAPELPIYHISCISPLFFGSYLAGLIEGDGTIVVPKQERSAKGRLNYPCVKIAFPLKDFPLCQFIQKQIGHGSISKVRLSAAYVLTVNNLEGLIVLSSLINGKIRGPKYYQFKHLIEYLSQKSDTFHMKPGGYNTSPILSDSWLCGFIEADGYFGVRTSVNSKYPRISLSFELTQSRMTGYGFSIEGIMQHIASFLEINLEDIRSERKYPQYRLRTSSLRTNQNIRDYLLKYPLKGTKYLDFVDWCKVLWYFEQGTHKENTATIVEIKSQINQRRTVYNWDHLQ